MQRRARRSAAPTPGPGEEGSHGEGMRVSEDESAQKHDQSDTPAQSSLARDEEQWERELAAALRESAAAQSAAPLFVHEDAGPRGAHERHGGLSRSALAGTAAADLDAAGLGEAEEQRAMLESMREGQPEPGCRFVWLAGGVGGWGGGSFPGAPPPPVAEYGWKRAAVMLVSICEAPTSQSDAASSLTPKFSAAQVRAGAGGGVATIERRRRAWARCRPRQLRAARAGNRHDGRSGAATRNRTVAL